MCQDTYIKKINHQLSLIDKIKTPLAKLIHSILGDCLVDIAQEEFLDTSFTLNIGFEEERLFLIEYIGYLKDEFNFNFAYFHKSNGLLVPITIPHLFRKFFIRSTLKYLSSKQGLYFSTTMQKYITTHSKEMLNKIALQTS